MRFQFLNKYQKEYDIQKACKTLWISHSGFYDYLYWYKSRQTIENEALAKWLKRSFMNTKGNRNITKSRLYLINCISILIQSEYPVWWVSTGLFQGAIQRDLVITPTKHRTQNERRSLGKCLKQMRGTVYGRRYYIYRVYFPRWIWNTKIITLCPLFLDFSVFF